MCALLTLFFFRGKIDLTKLKGGRNHKKFFRKIQRIHLLRALFYSIDTDHDAFAYSLPDKVFDRNVVRRLRYDSRAFICIIA